MFIKNYFGNLVQPFWKGDIFYIKLSPTSSIHCCLAKIKKKNDGRYEYFIEESKYFYTNLNRFLPEKKQGVFATRE